MRFSASRICTPIFAAAVLALAAGANAQTKWDMPTPYAATNFHTEKTIFLYASE